MERTTIREIALHEGIASMFAACRERGARTRVSPAWKCTETQSLTGLIHGGRRSGGIPAQSPDRDGTHPHWVPTDTFESLVLLVSFSFLQDKTGRSGVDSGVGLG